MHFIIIIFFLLLSCLSSHAEELKIGLIPEQNVFAQLKRYSILGDYIKKKSGLTINFIVLSRYGNLVSNFQKENLDGAFFGSYTGALAIEQLGIDPIVRPVNLDGTSTYRGYIFVRKDSGIKTVKEMKGKRVVFVEKATTAGYVFPIAYFKTHKVSDIDKYFKEYYFSGSHDAAVYAVLNRKADIGCAKNTIFDMLAQKDSRVRNELTILAQSPPVPQNGLGLRKNIPEPLKEKLYNLLINMDKDMEGRDILKKFGALRFIPTQRDDYRPVYQIAEDAGINIKSYRYINK